MPNPLNQPPILQQPTQLFQAPVKKQPTLSGLQAPTVIPGDQSRFSKVSRILQPWSQITLPSLPSLRQLPQQVLKGLERGWQALKDTFTFQFEESGRLGTAKEAQANCGPASATMILKQFGVSAPTMQQLRQLVGAPVGSRSGAFALSTQQVISSVKKAASQKGVTITAEEKSLTTNVDTALAEMKRRLDKGEKLILLTSNISSLSRGHYIVVKEVRADGSILVDDPGSSKGENRVFSRKQLEKALKTRVQTYGLGNTLLAFRRG